MGCPRGTMDHGGLCVTQDYASRRTTYRSSALNCLRDCLRCGTDALQQEMAKRDFCEGRIETDISTRIQVIPQKTGKNGEKTD